MGYRTLIRNHRGLLSIAFLAMFTSSLGQSFFIGLFQVPITARLGLSAGQFGMVYAVVTLVAGFIVLWEARVSTGCHRVVSQSRCSGACSPAYCC